MTTEPIVGQRYLYVGQVLAYRGRAGTLVRCLRAGRTWQVELSNVREWPAAGLDPQLMALATEIEPVEDSASARCAAHRTHSSVKETADSFTDEAEIVVAICAALTEAGYQVCQVGQRDARGSGTTVGYPDLSVRHTSWPKGVCFLLEVKTQSGQLSPEQSALHAQGWSHVVRSPQDALDGLWGLGASIQG